MLTKFRGSRFGLNLRAAIRALWQRRTKDPQRHAAMTSTQQHIGSSGERRAQQYLAERQMSLVTANYRCRYGEIDLIMRHGDCLVFVEVKQRKHARFGSPLEMVTLGKQTKLRRAAEHYIIKNAISGHQAMRFDVVGIIAGGSDETVEWVQNAF